MIDPQDDDPLEQLKKLKVASPAAESTGSGDPLAALMALRPKRRTLGGVDSGILRAPAESTAALSQSRSDASGDLQAVLPAAAANVLSAAQVIPGMEAFQAGAGVLGSKFTDHPMTYRESLDALRSQTDAIPGPIKVAGRLVGGGPLALIGGSPAAVGAGLGAADQLLDADPDRGVTSRLEGAAIGGTVGAALGTVADVGATKLRSVSSPMSGRVIRDMKNAREAASGPLFHSAITQGQGITALDPDVAMFVAQPKVKEIIDGLKGLKEFQNVGDDSPEMLDAVYKVLSDRGASAKRGLEAMTPNKPNLGRFTARDIRATKDDALTAMDAAMPDYRQAVQTYAEHSGQIGAVRRGQDAVRTDLQKGVTTGKNLDRTTRQAYEDWLSTASPAERDAAESGILGATKQSTKLTTPVKAIHALVKSPGLLRTTNTPQQRAIDALIRAGLISTNTLVPR